MHLWPITGLSLELAKCLPKDTTTKILQIAAELPYFVDIDKENVFSVAKWSPTKVHISRFPQHQLLAQKYASAD
jgi:hypothetical protein